MRSAVILFGYDEKQNGRLCSPKLPSASLLALFPPIQGALAALLCKQISQSETGNYSARQRRRASECLFSDQFEMRFYELRRQK